MGMRQVDCSMGVYLVGLKWLLLWECGGLLLVAQRLRKGLHC